LLGGYLAGRLRVKWTGLDRDELLFRDSAHGFLTWALGTIIAASFLASAASAVISAAASVGATAGAAATAAAAPAATEAMKSAKGGSGNGSAGESMSSNAGVVDTLFRNANPQANSGGNNGAGARAEAGRILSALKQGTDMSQEDRSYLTKSIAANTGISEQEADKRVNDALEQIKAREQQAREAADKARKAAAQSTLWTFIGLVLGAFTACMAAMWGGRQRDLV